MGDSNNRSDRPHGADEPTADIKEGSTLLVAGDGKVATGTREEILRRLGMRGSTATRYAKPKMIDEGGMGRILGVRDLDLHRRSAMKQLRQTTNAAEATPAGAAKLERFLEEAQVTAQLEHPGVVPVHELGLDSDGHVYFTMQLVRGHDLGDIIELARAERDGWSVVRVVSVVQKVCETMAYAHDRGVIHRDLKPKNIMVGRFGECYVMDWGVARIVSEEDRHGMRMVTSSVTDIDSDREALRIERPDSPFMTSDGQLVGTPAYMPPEQAGGQIEKLDARSDVYAVGAMLYELLTGQPPYVKKDMRIDWRTVVMDVVRRPPEPVESLTTDAPPELVAICEKAMAREQDDRYDSMLDMADDLRRFLETRVVRAYETGPIAELRKWIRRNRAAAALVALMVVVFVASGFVVALKEREVANAERENADNQRVIADAQREIAENEREKALVIRRDLDRALVAELLAAADASWPIEMGSVGAIDSWIAHASDLGTRVDRYGRELEALRSRAASTQEVLAFDAETLEWDKMIALGFVMDFSQTIRAWRRTFWHPIPIKGEWKPPWVVWINREVALLERARVLETCASIDARLRHRPTMTTWVFDEPVDAESERMLASLVADIESIAPDGDVGGAVARLRDRIDEVRRVSLVDHAEDWRRAIESVTTDATYGCPHLVPQFGLVPLRRDASSRLWEFWHVASGDRPRRDATGNYRIEEATGIVLVLMPGGLFAEGASSVAAPWLHLAPWSDPHAVINEQPTMVVTLDPFFISKYEMTIAQWLRAGGGMCMESLPGFRQKDQLLAISRTHPIEHASWIETERVLGHFGLHIPTGSQWEVSARGGKTTRYWAGARAESLRGRVNGNHEVTDAIGVVLPNDQFSHTAPVDAFAPNQFGLYNVLGNVWEWTLDYYIPSIALLHSVREGTGERIPLFSNAMTARGGGFKSGPDELRVTYRRKKLPNGADEDIGVRPARPVHGKETSNHALTEVGNDE